MLGDKKSLDDGYIEEFNYLYVEGSYSYTTTYSLGFKMELTIPHHDDDQPKSGWTVSVVDLRRRRN